MPPDAQLVPDTETDMLAPSAGKVSKMLRIQQVFFLACCIFCLVYCSFSWYVAVFSLYIAGFPSFVGPGHGDGHARTQRGQSPKDASYPADFFPRIQAFTVRVLYAWQFHTKQSAKAGWLPTPAHTPALHLAAFFVRISQRWVWRWLPRPARKPYT